MAAAVEPLLTAVTSRQGGTLVYAVDDDTPLVMFGGDPAVAQVFEQS